MGDGPATAVLRGHDPPTRYGRRIWRDDDGGAIVAAYRVDGERALAISEAPQLTRSGGFRMMSMGLLRVIAAGVAAVAGCSRRRSPAPVGWRRE